MAVITSYPTLLTAISDYLARSDLTTFTPNFVQNFEERFYRNPRNFGPWMNSGALSVTFTTTASVPSDFLSARSFYLNGKNERPLVVSSLEQVLMKYPRSGSSGAPKWITRDGDNFVFGPVPNGSYTLNGSYYAKPDLLRDFASDADAHYLIVNAPDLLLYGSLVEAHAFIVNDARIALWQAKYEEALRDYRDLQKAQGFSGGSMQTLVA